MSDSRKELLKTLSGETAKIAWSELMRFFAAGRVVYVEADLDLVSTAVEFALNDKAAIQLKMKRKNIAWVEDKQAIDWTESDATLWAVVVAPWVLVQEIVDIKEGVL